MVPLLECGRLVGSLYMKRYVMNSLFRSYGCVSEK